MKTRILVVTLLASLLLFSCSDDDVINTSKVEMKIETPKVLRDKKATLTKAVAVFENVNTGQKTSHNAVGMSLTNLLLEDGIYNITVNGDVSYETSYTVIKKVIDPETGKVVIDPKTKKPKTVTETVTEQTTGKVKGFKENVNIKGGQANVSIPLFLLKENVGGGFVLSELYYTGSKTPEGKQYRQDKFFEIYNNSDKTLYADGLCIGEGALLTVSVLNEYTPDIRPNEFPLAVVYRVPGSGKQYPVEPGKTLVLADIGINHKTDNPNSIDLSKANFEWYDDHRLDVDVPEVPNLEKIVSYSRSIWTPHNRGFKSYVIFKLNDSEAKQFAKTNAYEYSYKFVRGTFERVMKFKYWKIANEKIIDAVECSTPSKYEWKTMSPALDLTWTHTGDGDDARYGHSLKRRISHKEGDRIILLDTNDSATDFIATAPNPSPGTVEDHK